MFLLLLSLYSSAFFHSTAPSTLASAHGSVFSLFLSEVAEEMCLLLLSVPQLLNKGLHCCPSKSTDTTASWPYFHGISLSPLVCGWDAKEDLFLQDREPLYQLTLSQGLSMCWLNLPQIAWQARLQWFHRTFLLSPSGARPTLRSESSSWPSQPHLLSHRHFS